MFSSLKSKFSNNSTSPQPPASVGVISPSDKNHEHHGISSMNAALQRKFARGVHYNLKLLLRGDRNTGKSCLFKRLQVRISANKAIFYIDARTFFTFLKVKEV